MIKKILKGERNDTKEKFGSTKVNEEAGDGECMINFEVLFLIF